MEKPQWHSGHFAGMMRNPVDRIASGFLHTFHDCDEMASASHIAPNLHQSRVVAAVASD